jgi:hypothetical protein
MPRYINITVGCDWPECTTEAAEGEDTVVNKTLAVDGRQPKTFLLCKEHRDELDEIHAPLLASGVKVDAPPKKSRSTSPSSTAPASSVSPSAEAPATKNGIDCKVCGRVLKNGAGVAQHVQRGHGFESYAEYKAQYNIDD